MKCSFSDVETGDLFVYRLAVYRKLGKYEAIRMPDHEGQIVSRYDLVQFVETDEVVAVRE